MDQIETATGDHLRGALPTAATAFLGGSQMMDQDLDLVVLTCNVLFQGIDAVLDLLGLLALQLDKRLAVKVDLVVQVSNPMLLHIHQGSHIVIHGLKTMSFDLQLVNRLEHSQQPVVQTFIGRHRSSFQFIKMPFGIFNVVDQAIPDVIQHQDGVVDTSRKAIKLSEV